MQEGTFIGIRQANETCAVYVVKEGKAWPLPPRLDVRNHSPAGFNWGYLGSGPAQLALAILCEVTQDDSAAEVLYQRYKTDVMTKLPAAFWSLTRDDVEGWIMMELHRRHRGEAIDLADYRGLTP